MGVNVSKVAVSDRTNGKSSVKVSAATKSKVTAFLEDDYKRRLNTSAHELSGLLSSLPEGEDILQVYYYNGFNLLQKCAAENNVEAIKLILTRDPNADVNDYPCSLPLHIACMKGHTDVAQYLIEHGARLDIEARLCWPGPHLKSCPGLKNETKAFRRETTHRERALLKKEGRDKCQNAFFHTIDGQQAGVLDYLLFVQAKQTLDISSLTPMLEVATANGAWNCCNILLEHKALELDEEGMRTEAYTPGVRPEMTFLHFLFNMVSQPAEFVLKTCKALLRRGLIPEMDVPDYLGNTPIHCLVIRYAFEETRRMWLRDYRPWDRVETKEMINILLQGGAVASINQPGSSTMALVVHYINDWKFIFDLLSTILDLGASPLVKDKEGRCPLMVCIMKLINDDLYQKLDFGSKAYFSRCLSSLFTAGASPNFELQPPMTSLHGIIFSISENFSCTPEEKMVDNFDFLISILHMFFQNGLDADAGTASDKPNVFRGILKLVERARRAIELEKIYELVVVLIQHGVDPNIQLRFPAPRISVFPGENPFLVSEHNYLLAHMVAVLAERQYLLKIAKRACLGLLNVINYSMDYKELIKCLDLLCPRLPDTPAGSPLRILSDAIREMRSAPRELKHSVREYINRVVLKRRPALYAHLLPLPNEARRYLMRYSP